MAGFRREGFFAALPPYKIVAGGEGTSYTYAHPKGCCCVYVGDRQAYERYRELAVSEAVARDMSVGAPNTAWSGMSAWASWDPRWAPTDAWDDPEPAPTSF